MNNWTPKQIAKQRQGFERLMTGPQFRLPLEDLKWDPETQSYDDHEIQIRFVCWLESRRMLAEELSSTPANLVPRDKS